MTRFTLTNFPNTNDDGISEEFGIVDKFGSDIQDKCISMCPDGITIV